MTPPPWYSSISPGSNLGRVNPTSSVVTEVKRFVGILGASNCPYAEATRTPQLPEVTPLSSPLIY